MRKYIVTMVIVILLTLNVVLLGILNETTDRLEDLLILYHNTKRELRDKKEEIKNLNNNIKKSQSNLHYGISDRALREDVSFQNPVFKKILGKGK